ncbi:Ribonuclease BN, tRNA processing enzyme [Blastococcus mobilis]|uniref:Ribonuclease BN, tRNA processing enzyme n=2 Tax=Blastococcus mobilis TaxID=1938746 RepID=A0A239AK99_9ACTN|nr:Ribonuclease BN, tRNA processing enzyme [Blastococcus mobilis]
MKGTHVSSGMELITLGTAAGPAIRGPEGGIASAVVIGDVFYLVDFGLGVTRAAHAAGLRGNRFRAGFLSHLHSDHIGELPGFLLWNWGPPVDGFTEPVTLIGPGADPGRGHGGCGLAGTRQLVAGLLDAFSYDLHIREADEARPSMADLLRVEELTPDRIADAEAQPFPVYEDDRVRVTAVLVDHPPVFPAFGFRFDSDHGSITFSGDTAESVALSRLAVGTDILVHEAVNLGFYAAAGFDAAFVNHQRISHTTPAGAGRVAEAAGAKQLVLSHLAGVAEPDYWETEAAGTFSGSVQVARSGDRFPVRDSRSAAIGPV